jgi:uncharacterized membrane protein YqiK
MDVLNAMFNTLTLIVWAPIVIVLLIIGFVVFRLRYKIAKSNQALVISGGKKKKGEPQAPIVLVSGGGICFST